jgi:predicted DNA-binding protein YlxM (UPF0122 family)
MKYQHKVYTISILFSVFFSYLIYGYITKDNVVVQDPQSIYTQIKRTEKMISNIEALPLIPKLAKSWDLLSEISEINNLELTYLTPESVKNIALYSGDQGVWHGMLKGGVLDVLAVAYYVSNKIPVKLYKITVIDGQAEVHLSLLGDY